MKRVIIIAVTALLVLQIAYFASNIGKFTFAGLHYLEAPVGTLLWLYVMLSITVGLLFLLVLRNLR